MSETPASLFRPIGDIGRLARQIPVQLRRFRRELLVLGIVSGLTFLALWPLGRACEQSLELEVKADQLAWLSDGRSDDPSRPAELKLVGGFRELAVGRVDGIQTYPDQQPRPAGPAEFAGIRTTSDTMSMNLVRIPPGTWVELGRQSDRLLLELGSPAEEAPGSPEGPPELVNLPPISIQLPPDAELVVAGETWAVPKTVTFQASGRIAMDLIGFEGEVEGNMALSQLEFMTIRRSAEDDTRSAGVREARVTFEGREIVSVSDSDLEVKLSSGRLNAIKLEPDTLVATLQGDFTSLRQNGASKMPRRIETWAIDRGSYYTFLVALASGLLSLVARYLWPPMLAGWKK